MNEHDELEPKMAAAPPTVTYDVPPPQPAVAVPVAPAGRAEPVKPVYVFGNPFGYVLRRFAAFVLDFALVTTVATSLLYGLVAVNPFTGLPTNTEGGFDATLGAGAGIALLYLVIFEAIFGATLGKLAFSLHVYAPGKAMVGIGRAVVRNLLRPVDLLVIGALLALLPGHRRLGDMLSGTLVARSPLRAFSPLVGWVLIIVLAGVPFLVGGGTVTILAVFAAFVQFVPHLVERALNLLLHLIGGVRTQ